MNKKMIGVILLLLPLAALPEGPLAEATTTEGKGRRNVIFIHPDGAAQAHFTATRLFYYGPDGTLNWDKLPHVAVYKCHILDNLEAGSVAGAVAHAAGIKTKFNYYGLDPEKRPIRTIMEDARDDGFATGLINSGTITEPGTGVFVAKVEDRNEHAEIARQIIESGVYVILGGGERWFLPKGVMGRHGEGVRKDGVNLIERAKELGYTIVYTKEELARIDPKKTTKILGLFASHHTFNDKPEEELYQRGLPLYWNYSPTIAEMVDVAIQILSRNSKGFLLVVEEEGTDNFSNRNNAEGMIEAVKRADEAIGVALMFAKKNPRTLLITAADTDAGGPAIWTDTLDDMSPRKPLPSTDKNGAPIDGVGFLEGKDYEVPFLTPEGRPFAISWATFRDEAGGIIARAYGAYGELISGTIDNTDVNKIMQKALGL